MRCLEEGWTRQHLHTQFLQAGGTISYSWFCKLTRCLLAERELVLGVREQATGAKSRGDGGGAPLLDARRNGSHGKTIGTLRAEQAAALSKVAH
jgi:hypothetical protein